MRSFGVLLALLPLAGPARAEDASAAFEKRVLPILKDHCAECHSGPKPKGKLDLVGPRSLEQLRTQGLHWFGVLERVESGSMPPKSAGPLRSADVQMLAGWVRGEFTDLLVEQQRREGRSKLRRLSRLEYANTVQDIFGVRPPVVRLMPGDGRVDGYDKVSAALSFSTAATEGQLKIAEEMVTRMFDLPTKKSGARMWAVASEQSAGHLLELEDGWKVSFNTDANSGPLRRSTSKDDKKPNGWPGPPGKPGRYRLRMEVYGYQTDKPLPVGIYAGHVWAYPQILDLLQVVDVPPGKPSFVEAVVYLRTGWNSDGPGDDGLRLIPLGLGVPVPKNSQASVLGKGKPGLAIRQVDVEELEDTLPGQRILTSDLTQAMREAFSRNGTLKNPQTTGKFTREELQATVRTAFGRVGALLFRRDLTAAELARHVKNYMKEIDEGSPLRAPFVSEVVAMMTAPDFLCVIEKPGKLDDFALASRLSYFLWNSTPDEELLALARQDKLGNSEVLRAQTERLLADPKSDRFVKDFLDQWLGLWGIDNTTPDRDLYPEYDDLLKFSSTLETRAAFRHMLARNLSIRDIVAPQWAFVNSRLAKHYGLPPVDGFALRETRLPADTPFGGLWTQASTMKVTANGTLTSPVKRGVWVAERLLGITIPPPPPNIEPVDPDTRGARTLREQLALHRGKGSCAACHARFDPYGFALESFDVMGSFRTNYRVADPGSKKKWKEGLPVDCSGTAPGGKAFAGVKELRAMLAGQPEQLARGVTRHLITYATGQPATPVDQPAIEAIVKAAAKDDHGLRSLVHGVVQSELFRSK
jgi:mono/diheme cytochrome c family protein